jgi:hypothetical protein
MSRKTQSVSQTAKRPTRNPVELRSEESPKAVQLNGHSQDIHAHISKRAYALYEEHGREDGYALKDWLEAEQQILNEG